MLKFGITVVLVALATAFIILFISISGIRDYLYKKSPIKLFSKMLDCDFCLSFWTAIALCVILVLFTHNFIYIIVPIFTTPITRLLI